MRHSYEPDLERLTTLEQSVSYLTDGFGADAVPHIHQAAQQVWPLRQGEPALPDPFAVAALLKELGADSDCIIAALYGCHKARTEIPKESLPDSCSPRQLQLIEGVRWLNSFSSDGGHLSSRDDDRSQQAERVRQLLLVMIEDVRALLIKLAFRVQRLHLLLKLKHESSVAVARETLDIYAPLANRLGVAQVKWQLNAYHAVGTSWHRQL